MDWRDIISLARGLKFDSIFFSFIGVLSLKVFIEINSCKPHIEEVNFSNTMFLAIYYIG
jgi:hypothetical protein